MFERKYKYVQNIPNEIYLFTKFYFIYLFYFLFFYRLSRHVVL
jgi:hypothetical protein